jgi:hypothetical protein
LVFIFLIAICFFILFLIDFFSISRVSILFHFIFMSNLVHILLIAIFYTLELILFFQFHPSTWNINLDWHHSFFSSIFFFDFILQHWFSWRLSFIIFFVFLSMRLS